VTIELRVEAIELLQAEELAALEEESRLSPLVVIQVFFIPLGLFLSEFQLIIVFLFIDRLKSFVTQLSLLPFFQILLSLYVQPLPFKIH